jgi:RNA polymerase sigma factor (sigma-70 family)
MKNRPSHPPHAKRKNYVAAMFLSTALSALGAAHGTASQPPAKTVRAISDLSRYCTACWRNAHLHPDCWTDCTQEVFSRLLERVDPHAWDRLLKDEGEERREFLRAIDTVKKRSQRARSWAPQSVDLVADRNEERERQLNDDREAVRQASAEVLSERQQQIIQLSFDGWSVHDIATELHVPPERVSDEKYKAIRRLREYLRTVSEN